LATDYDAPRKTETDESADESLEALAGRRTDAATAVIDVDEGDDDMFDLPGADLSGEELSVRVVPKQADEFTCSRCFLVHHRNRLAMQTDRQQICTDCI
jgi:hypothetical protein